MPTLPTNEDGSLRPFTAAEYAAFGIKRRGVTGEGDHIITDLGPDGSGCTRRFFCNWEQRFQVAIYFVGAATIYSTESVDAVLSRLLPQRDPVFTNWVATKVRISPYRFTGSITPTGEDVDENSPTKEPLAEFTQAAIDVTYEMVPMALKTDAEINPETTGETARYVTWPGNIGADASTDASYIGLPGGVLNYVTVTGVGVPAGRSIPYAVGFVEGSKKLKIVWRRVPEDAWGPTSNLFSRVIGTETTRGMIGSVNKTAFRGYPPLSLMLLGVEERLLPDPTGLGYSWDLGYVISYAPKPYGHLGYFFHDIKGVPAGNTGDKSGYYQVLRPPVPPATPTTKAAADLADNDSLFPVREFKDLFQVGDVV